MSTPNQTQKTREVTINADSGFTMRIEFHTSFSGEFEVHGDSGPNEGRYRWRYLTDGSDKILVERIGESNGLGAMFLGRLIRALLVYTN